MPCSKRGKENGLRSHSNLDFKVSLSSLQEREGAINETCKVQTCKRATFVSLLWQSRRGKKIRFSALFLLLNARKDSEAKRALCWLQFAFWVFPFPCSFPLAVLLSKQLKSQRNVFPALFGPLHRGEEPFSFCKRDEKCQKLLVQIAHHLISCAHLLHDVRMIFLHFHRMGQRGCNDEHLRELFQLRTERCQFSEVKRDRTVWTGGFANHVLKKRKKSASKNGSKQARTKNAVRENGEIRF